MTDERQALREVLEFIADWAHDCSPSNAATPWDRQHPDEIDPRAYGFDDIEERCRAALAVAQAPALDWPTLANIIREVDGNHDLGAGELAERILAHPRFRAVAQVPAEERAIREIEAAVVSGGALDDVHAGCVRKVIEVLRATPSAQETSHE